MVDTRLKSLELRRCSSIVINPFGKTRNILRQISFLDFGHIFGSGTIMHSFLQANRPHDALIAFCEARAYVLRPLYADMSLFFFKTGTENK